MQTLTLFLTAVGAWKLNWFSADCVEDITCCGVGRCLPPNIVLRPGDCINNSDFHCIFDVTGKGLTYIDDERGKPQDGCGGTSQGELIFSMPAEYTDARFRWTSGNVTLGPIDRYNAEPCYTTDWFVQFVKWPGHLCDSGLAMDDEALKVTSKVRWGPYYTFDKPYSDIWASDAKGNVYVTVDMSPWLNHPSATAVRLIAANPDCRLNAVVNDGAKPQLGQDYALELSGRAFTRRGIYVHMNGRAHGMKGKYEPVTAPAR